MADDPVERDPDRHACPVCGKEFDSELKVRLHDRFAHRRGELKKRTRAPRSRTRPAAAAPTPRVSEAQVQAVVDKSVGNLIVAGGFLSIILPHTGLAISGVPDPSDPSGQRMLVQSRAVTAGAALQQWALRDARVYEALRRFNTLFEASAMAEVVGSLGAAVAVDVGIVNPHLAIQLGPTLEIRPVEAMIGDVVSYVDQERERFYSERPDQRPEPAAPNGRPSAMEPDAEVVEGGVEAT